MSETIKSAVRDRYAAVARNKFNVDSPGVRKVAQAFGYSADELASIPATANMGLSCGNPTATANLRAGEVVVDLGSGGGLDVFLAARKVGATGKAIGIDMTADMIERARQGAREAGLGNVEFHLSEIESMPLESDSADCVISNCVLNLVPDKPKAFVEIFRILKPGGRFAVSDIVLKKSLPVEVTQNMLAYIGCVAGAITIDQYRKDLEAAGFRDVVIIDSEANLAVYLDADNTDACCSSLAQEQASLPVVESGCCAGSAAGSTGVAAVADTTREKLIELMSRYDINDYAASVKIFALKPRACC